jgi:hypothetical protein
MKTLNNKVGGIKMKKVKRMVSLALTILMCSSLSQITKAESLIPAFPGAEGGGMYTTGGRGYDVYEVTTLEDYDPTKGEAVIPGSLRDAVSSSNRTIVFRVSGTINLKRELTLKYIKNLTIAGQTAPGDGICVAGFSTNLSNSENIILRYMRFRPGSENIDSEPDAIWGRDIKNLIIDHISASWSTDETLSFYRNTNITVQWSIINESLTVSGHAKGRHGYGGIWGGENSTFHHNLMATHTSRTPRIGQGAAGNGSAPATFDMRNNVIYQWGFNSTYGGENSFINIVNNYYKPGPGTREDVINRIVQPGAAGKPSQWYIAGNFMFGSKEVTKDNIKGVADYVEKDAALLDAPNDIPGAKYVTTENAEKAYKEVLEKAGAVLPRRDAVDSRIVQDVKDGTGRFINREYEVGGYPELKSAEAPLDTDHDGMPDAWEVEKGLDPNNKEDGKAITDSGYSNLEIYLNSIADMNFKPDNPVVKVITPKMNGTYLAGGQMTIDVEAKDKDGIGKVEFYKNDEKLGEDIEAPYSFTWDNAVDGTYFITARAYDKDGNSTQSTSLPVHVNSAEISESWTSADVGNVRVTGNGSMDEYGVMTVKGAGKIAGTNDSFHFVYQPLKDNGSLTAKLESISLLDNNAISGLMIRENLDVDSPAAIISTSIVKADRDEDKDGFVNDTYYSTFFSSRKTKGENIKTLGFYDYPDVKPGLPTLLDNKLPIWLKIERIGNEIIGYTSYDGTTWRELGRETFNMGRYAYIGFAVDATQTPTELTYYNTAKFSNVQIDVKPINIASIKEIPAVEVKVGKEVTLPETVTAVYENGTEKELKVKWDREVDSSKVGQQIIEGTIEGYDGKVIVTVNVAKPVTKDIIITDDFKELDEVLSNEEIKVINVKIGNDDTYIKALVLNKVKGTDKAIIFSAK